MGREENLQRINGYLKYRPGDVENAVRTPGQMILEVRKDFSMVDKMMRSNTHSTEECEIPMVFNGEYKNSHTGCCGLEPPLVR
jgi:hypothetical protein